MEEIKVETDESLDIDRSTSELQSDIKYDIDEELRIGLKPKNELDCYSNETYICEGNFESTEGTSHFSTDFLDQLSNGIDHHENEYCSSGGNQSINKEHLKYGHNYLNEDQWPSEVKQEICDREDYIDAIFKQEIEFVNVQENKDMVDDFIHNEGNMWNKDAEVPDQCSQEMAIGSFNGTATTDAAKIIKKKKKRLRSVFDGYEANLERDVGFFEASNQIALRNSAERVKFELTQFQSNKCEYITTQENNQLEHLISDHLNSKITKYSSSESINSIHPDFERSKSCSSESGCIKNHLNVEKYRECYVEGVQSAQEHFKCSNSDYEPPKTSKVTSYVKDGRPEREDFKCHKCDYVAHRKFDLKVHVEAVHLKLRNFKCSFCDYRAYSKSNIISHAHSVHSEYKLFTCQWCDYGTGNERLLTTHVDTVHLKKKDFKCLMCDYAALRKGDLKRHVEAVHFKRKNYKCNLCEYQSYFKFSYKTHMNKIHKCKLCYYETCKKSDLDSHMYVVHS